MLGVFPGTLEMGPRPRNHSRCTSPWGGKQAGPEQVEVCSAVHQAFHELELSELPLGLSRRPWLDEAAPTSWWAFAATCPAGLPDGAAAARWFRLIHLRMPADLRRELFGADRLQPAHAETAPAEGGPVVMAPREAGIGPFLAGLEGALAELCFGMQFWV